MVRKAVAVVADTGACCPSVLATPLGAGDAADLARVFGALEPSVGRR